MTGKGIPEMIDLKNLGHLEPPTCLLTVRDCEKRLDGRVGEPVVLDEDGK
jgi:hypothetical protein